jgi:hypothetical protein
LLKLGRRLEGKFFCAALAFGTILSSYMIEMESILEYTIEKHINMN